MERSRERERERGGWVVVGHEIPISQAKSTHIICLIDGSPVAAEKNNKKKEANDDGISSGL